MAGLRPIFNGLATMLRPRLVRMHRLYLSTLSPHAPSDLHLRGALRLANLEKQA